MTMNWASSSWYLVVLKYVAKNTICFGVYKRFMNCHKHPHCLIKNACMVESFDSQEKVQVNFT